MMIFKLTQSLSVAAQLDLLDLPILSKQGFDVVVCNRPDGETLGQPTMDQLESACLKVDMSFFRYPVTHMNFPGPDLSSMKAIFDAPDKRVLAYCRSGTRCANLWVASRADEEKEFAIDLVRRIGFDLSMVR